MDEISVGKRRDGVEVRLIKWPDHRAGWNWLVEYREGRGYWPIKQLDRRDGRALALRVEKREHRKENL